jgi:hypothetical protein
MTRPATVTIAVVLQWVAAAAAIFAGLQLITAAIELSDKDVESAVGQAITTAGVTDVSASLVVEGLLIAGAVVFALAILRIVLAVYLARGRAWARVIITILVVLNLLTGVAYLFQEAFVQAIGTFLLELVVLWLLYNPQASAFIESRTNEPISA